MLLTLWEADIFEPWTSLDCGISSKLTLTSYTILTGCIKSFIMFDPLNLKMARTCWILSNYWDRNTACFALACFSLSTVNNYPYCIVVFHRLSPRLREQMQWAASGSFRSVALVMNFSLAFPDVLRLCCLPVKTSFPPTAVFPLWGATQHEPHKSLRCDKEVLCWDVKKHPAKFMVFDSYSKVARLREMKAESKVLLQ